MFFCNFRYFLAEIEGLEQKSDSEAEEGLQMLLDSDLPALEMDFLESSIQDFSKIYNSLYFSLVLTMQTGVQTPTSCPILELNARNRLQSRVKRQKQVTNWRLTPRKTSTRESFNAQPKHTPSGPGSGFLHHLLISVNPSN